MNTKKNILLTGAGFSANFGGFLAREMWSKILNNRKLEDLSEVKKLLMKNFNFEEIYSEVVRSGSFAPDDKILFQDIILESYEAMDEVLKRFCIGFRQYNVCWAGVASLLAMFEGVAGEPGVHFTLNQDLLLERAVQRHPLGMSAAMYREYWDEVSTGRLDHKKTITLPDDAALADFKNKHLPSVGGLYYVKLHGSQGWLSATGANQIVIGTNKFEDIQKEPLLRWYFELFEAAINRKDVKLFVIGYGFKDEHINKCLIRAIEEYGLRLYIISPEDPESFKSRMEGRPDCPCVAWEESLGGKKIWHAVSGYSPFALKDIFPADCSETHAIRDIKRFFNS